MGIQSKDERKIVNLWQKWDWKGESMNQELWEHFETVTHDTYQHSEKENGALGKK